MSVRPTRLRPALSAVDYLHDEATHSGQIPIANLDTVLSGDERSLIVTCPACGFTSVHPIAGGVDPEIVQRIFVWLVMRRRAIAWLVARAIVKLKVIDMEGDGRWRLENVGTIND